MKLRTLWLSLLVLLPACPAFSSAALLLEEPYGAFGYINPTGHAAIYLSHVCAASPTKLRTCAPREAGVVISRYHRVDGYDAVAIPLIPYLYAVDRVENAPQWADTATVTSLRDAWRRKHLQAVAPDAHEKDAAYSDWPLLVGGLYDRKIYAFEVKTTTWQDEAFIDAFNRRPNRNRFNLFYRNCADFARGVLDFYYPHSVRRSYTADLGMTTPKQLAKSLDHYGARHEQLDLESFILPQVAGSIRRSKQVEGVAEAILRKKYVVPLAILSPYVAAGIALTYFGGGRFNPGKNAMELERTEIVESLSTGVEPFRLDRAFAAAELAERTDRGKQSPPASNLAAETISGPHPELR